MATIRRCLAPPMTVPPKGGFTRSEAKGGFVLQSTYSTLAKAVLASLMNSAIWKLAEFAKLRYPTQALLRACSLVAVNTRNATWFKVRGTFSKYAYQYAPP